MSMYADGYHHVYVIKRNPHDDIFDQAINAALLCDDRRLAFRFLTDLARSIVKKEFAGQLADIVTQSRAASRCGYLMRKVEQCGIYPNGYGNLGPEKEQTNDP